MPCRCSQCLLCFILRCCSLAGISCSSICYPRLSALIMQVPDGSPRASMGPLVAPLVRSNTLLLCFISAFSLINNRVVHSLQVLFTLSATVFFLLSLLLPMVEAIPYPGYVLNIELTYKLMLWPLKHSLLNCSRFQHPT